MSVRSQITKLKQQASGAQFDTDVRAIGALMDELGALAAGGSGIRGEVSLIEILDETLGQHWPDQDLHNQKVTQ